MTRVLIVDDYADARDLLAGYLSSCGYETEEAIDGRDAVARALEDPPDIVLMDIAMPVMDGVEATTRLKADPRTASIPVIAVTGQARDPDSVVPPCDAVLVKPVDPIRVEEEVRRVLAAKVSPGDALGQARRAGARARRAQAKDAMGREVLWLFVEADAIRQAILHLLQREGYAVTAFKTVSAAFERPIEALPDAVVIDLALPEDDAVELALAVREQPELSHVIVIGLTDEHSSIPAEIEPLFDARIEKSDGILELPGTARRLIAEMAAQKPSDQPCTAKGERVSTLRHEKVFGTVLEAHPTFFLLDVPLRGAFVVPSSAILSREQGHVVLEGSMLDDELRTWLGEDLTLDA